MLVEEAGERGGGHAYEVGKGGQAYLVHVVLVDIVLDLEHAAAVALDDDLGVGRAGQGAGIRTLGQLVEYLEQFHAGLPAVGDAADADDARTDFADGILGEGKTLASIVEHELDGAEGISGKDTRVREIYVKLQGDFVDIF